MGTDHIFVTQEDSYVLTCYRYIELNPIRAGMVAHPGEYPWSSYRSNGEGKSNAMLTPHPHYLALGLNVQQRLAAYRNLLQVQMNESDVQTIRKATNANYALGTELFQSEIANMLQRRVAPARRGRPRNQ